MIIDVDRSLVYFNRSFDSYTIEICDKNFIYELEQELGCGLQRAYMYNFMGEGKRIKTENAVNALYLIVDSDKTKIVFKNTDDDAKDSIKDLLRPMSFNDMYDLSLYVIELIYRKKMNDGTVKIPHPSNPPKQQPTMQEILEVAKQMTRKGKRK